MVYLFVETSVLTDFLIKKDGSETAAKAALDSATSVEIPQFAWKEFKRGPLKHFIWLHNKLVLLNSFQDTLIALQRLSQTPQRYKTATAIQAFHSAFSSILSNSLKNLIDRGEPGSSEDQILCRALRLEIHHRILQAWQLRDKLYGGYTLRLECYPDEELSVEKNGTIDNSPSDCPKRLECCLKAALVQRRDDVTRVRDAIPSDPPKEENSRRRKVLKRVSQHATSLMDRDDCRALGDAYFVLFCPTGFAILTNNMKDIQPLADAIGVTARRP